MAKKSKEEKALEKKVDHIVGHMLQGVQVDMMDLGKISDEGMRAAKEGKDIVAAVSDIIAKVRKN